ncbi:MAG: hypothetical protein GY699_06630 [Desulfobacteraceae bacterium]|nr:hypothetical protein [Desulfobacteraceae bacterium]
MCEPYIVDKDDWLYKIFRKKGEISEKDFPHFLIIFKEINPKISNIDAIEPGIQILIPLKKIEKEDYDQSTPGSVDVPVIEFSTLPEDLDLTPFIKEHKIKKNENISSLIDKDFLNKSGAISKEGLKAFHLANPNIKNINIVYEGADIYLPDPSIKSQPWFQSFLSGNPPQDETQETKQEVKQYKVEAFKLLQLKKYSSLIGGTLLSHGKMYFPENNNSSQVLDLSSVPIIETDDGSKILIISGENVNDELLKSAQAYWEDLKIQLLSETIDNLKDTLKNNKLPKKINKTYKNNKLIEILLSQTKYTYIPNAKIPFTLNNINLEASFGRIIREDSTDLLINFGNVYGSALDVLEKREFKIISITSQLPPIELINKLFSNLGYSTWENPSFFTGETVENLDGLYAVKELEKLFIPIEPLSSNAVKYLKKEEVKILITKKKISDQ